MDNGAAETELLQHQLEYRIRQHYGQARKDLEEKVNKYYKDFQKLDDQKLKDVSDGKLTMEDYKKWRRAKVMSGKVWEQRKEAIATDLYNANDIAQSMIYGYLPEVYAANHNFATYQIEQKAEIDTSYVLYNREAVEKLIAEQPDLIPYQRINEKLDKSWNKKNIQAVMLQGILQGESIPHLAKRLSKHVVQRDKNAAIRNARTMTTAAQNSGKYDAMERAASLGVNIQTKWKAVLDDRTRDRHREYDGMIRELGEEFPNGLRYPVDIARHMTEISAKSAEGKAICAETYNCRCSIQPLIEGLQPRAEKYRSTEAIGIPYEEWKKGHKAANEYRIANGMKPHNRKGMEYEPRKIKPKGALNKTDNLYNVKIADILGVDNDNIKISALPKEVQKNVLSAVEKSVLKCPQLKGWLKEIEFSNEVKEPALAESYSFSGKIRLGSHFLDADGIKRELQLNSDIQHMIKGANIESVVMHEIGHQIDALMTTKGIANATISQYGMIRTSHEVQREVLNELGFFDYIMESRKDLAERYHGRELNEMVSADRRMWIREHISEYASENNNEFWAELFAEYMSAEKPREAAQVFGNIFEKLLKEL